MNAIFVRCKSSHRPESWGWSRCKRFLNTWISRIDLIDCHMYVINSWVLKYMLTFCHILCQVFTWMKVFSWNIWSFPVFLFFSSSHTVSLLMRIYSFHCLFPNLFSPFTFNTYLKCASLSLEPFWSLVLNYMFSHFSSSLFIL